MASPDRPPQAVLERSAAFVQPLIGLAYEEGARGPETWDCWHLARHLAPHHWGIDLPDAPIDRLAETGFKAALHATWRPVPAPVHGAIGQTSTTTRPRHIVTYLANDRGGVIHALDGYGVVFWPLLQLRVYGCPDIHWYVPRQATAPILMAAA